MDIFEITETKKREKNPNFSNDLIDFTQLLLKEVEKYEYLYCKTHLRRFNKTENDSTWTVIAAKLGKSKKYCRYRWNTVRHAYKKCLEENTPYIFSPCLNFLKNNLILKNPRIRDNEMSKLQELKAEHVEPVMETEGIETKSDEQDACKNYSMSLSSDMLSKTHEQSDKETLPSNQTEEDLSEETAKRRCLKDISIKHENDVIADLKIDIEEHEIR